MSESIDENIDAIGQQITRERQEIHRLKSRLEILNKQSTALKRYISQRYENINTLQELPVKMREEEEKRNV
jgi:peptidoglycan hydrolase CwlO-like protein